MNSKDESDELKSMFFHSKPTDMIVRLELMDGSYASELSSKCDTTYSHAVKIMNRFADMGLVESSKKGRKKEYTLTEQGQIVADQLVSLFESVEGMERPFENANGGSISEIV